MTTALLAVMSAGSLVGFVGLFTDRWWHWSDRSWWWATITPAFVLATVWSIWAHEIISAVVGVGFWAYILVMTSKSAAETRDEVHQNLRALMLGSIAKGGWPPDGTLLLGTAMALTRPRPWWRFW